MRNGAIGGFALGVWLGLALVIGFTSMLLVVGLGVAGAIVGLSLTGMSLGAKEGPRRPAAADGNAHQVGYPPELRGVRH
jgi:hypothetical protein